MNSYNIGLEDRKIIEEMYNAGAKPCEIATRIGKCQATIYREIKRGEVCVSVDIRRTESYFELDIHTEGSVVIPCDLCLDDMNQPIETDDRLVVKFGEEYSEDDDLVTVEEGDGTLDLSWFVYEFIALNVPIKHVHAPGKCNAAMIKALEEHSATRSSDEDEETAVDPRWNELEKLKTIIKD